MKFNSNDLVKYVFFCLLAIFVTIYISYQNGYLEYSNYKKSMLTSEMIKQFENDVKEGIAIDVNNYLIKEKDYSNKISKVSLSVSNWFGGYVKKTLAKIFKSVNKLIE